MKMYKLKPISVFILALAIFLFNPLIIQAGFLDKLNAATQKLSDKTQQMNDKGQQKHTNSNGLKAGCEQGQGGATCLDYLDKHNKCFDPLKGYRAKLSADLIEKKLASETELDAQKRANLEEDLTALREAENNGTDDPTIAGRKNSSRYLMDITMDEQTQINTEYTLFYNKITSECQGRDVMGIGKTRKMNYVKDNSADMADRAKRDEAMGNLQTCMAQTQGLRWKVIADTLEKKMATQKLSEKEKEEWLEDISLVREAGEKNLMMPQSSDPTKSMRYAQKLTMEENMAVTNEYSRMSQAIIADCSSNTQKGLETKPKDRSKQDGGVVDYSKSPANKNAKSEKKNLTNGKWHVTKNTGALSCYLGACVLDGLKDITECSKQVGGYWWKVLADGIEEKLKNPSGLTQSDQVEMQEDVEALRRADAERMASYPAPDPSRSMRYQDWFNKKEFGELQIKYQNMYNAQMKYCNDTYGDIMKHN